MDVFGSLMYVSLHYNIKETHRLITSGTGMFPTDVSSQSTVNLIPYFFHEVSNKLLMHMTTQ